MSRIFVVEDEAIVCEDIAQTLRQLGYEVAGTAQSGMEALLAVEQQMPDLVLMDIKLAGRLDGIQTTAAIRKRWSIPVIYLTSHSDEATLGRAKETGPHGYLLKPFNERELRTAIEVALRKSELERKLEQRERWFSTTLESVGDAVIATDSEERITFMNAVAEAATGWSKEDAWQRPLREVFKLVVPGVSAEPATSQASSHGFRAELPHGSLLTDRRGLSHDVDDSVAPIVDAKGNVLGSVVVFRDITDKRRLEERVALAERLASISTMAAGMAHEINNPLAAAVGNLEFAQKRLDELGEEVRTQGLPSWVTQALSEASEALADARSASTRVQGIVRDLKKFSRAEEPTQQALDLPDVLQAALGIARHLVKVGTSVRPHLGTTPLVVANEGRLVQVFANLIANAIQAVSDPTRHNVDIVTRTDELGRAVVEISDNGEGIPAENLPRIFEPFFTTRRSGQGLGLGLSISQSTITALGGELSVESRPGAGAKFRVILPAASEERVKPRRPSDEPPPARRARVLVIDDEEIVGRTVERILMRKHDVLLETDPRQALSLLAQQSFDIVLCDVTMPQVTGRQVYETVLAGNPELAKRIVFLTGGALSDELEEFLAGLSNVVIHKPFSVDKLLAVVQSYAR